MGIRKSLAVLAVVGIFASCGDNLEPDTEVDSTVVTMLETSAPTQVKAGDAITVTCTLLENDVPTMVAADVRVVSEDSVMRMGKQVIARTVGTVEVTCALPDRGLIDPTPAIVEIVHGAAANVVTTITPDPVVAGNNVTATCAVYDAYGNLIEDGDAPALEISPIDAGNTVSGMSAFMTRAGHYTARCDLPGTTTNNAGFDVIPNLPASIVLARWPDLPVYAVGAIVDITHIVSDRYGNEILEPSVTRSFTKVSGSVNPVNVLAGQWRFDGEGRFSMRTTVDPPTEMGLPVTAAVDVVVNSRGPAIACVNDASMINLFPGSTYTVVGKASDENGVTSLTVNGQAVSVAQDGSWSAQITSRFGMNFVDITAIDSFGEPTTKVCTFLIANRYGGTTAPIADTVSLKLTPSAVDDGNRSNGLTSLADILHAVINSQGLRDTLHNSLLAANPLKPDSCDSSVFGICLYRSRVDYISNSLPGPHTVGLQLVTGGIFANVFLDNPSLQLRLRGHVSGIPYDTTGWVTFDYVRVQLIFDLSLQNNKPKITVRAGSVYAEVGGISTNFNGVDGWIINNILVPLAQGYIRDTVRNIIRDFVTNNFNAILDGVIGGLDVATLGATFNVPKLDGTGSIPMSFGLSFSSVNAQTSRLLFGIGTRFSTTAANAYPSLGVPYPSSPAVLLDPTVSTQNTAVSAHVAILNGALHALWRANFFAGSLGSSSVPGLPSGVTFVLNTRLPPVAYVSSAGIPQLHIGALDLTVSHPSLPPNLSVTLGAEAHTTVNLNGNDLSFGGIVVDALHVSTDAVNLSAQQQQDLQGVLISLIQDVVDESLNDALPALPIPSFTLPASVGAYGLPVGARLGIVSPTLQTSPQHFILRGQFGVQ